MLIFLPPSEGKSEPSGGPVELASLAFDDLLGEVRRELIKGLEELGRGSRQEAVEALGISEGQAGDVDRDAALSEAPTGPAIEVYSGVLFDRLDFGSLSAEAHKRAATGLLIASALWGAVRPFDEIPWYRLSMKAKLPGLGGLAAFWKPRLTEAMERAGFDDEGEVILDMRSAAYAAAWKPSRAELVAVRAFREEGGKRKAVSHMAKATRGEVARLVLSAGKEPTSPEDVATLIEGAGLTVELGDGTLDVIESA